ncbi:MAG TPA: cytochrome c [Steroidobacteraceae bacterium]|jgi:mono/diheme cytochrome c family protein
MRWLAGTVVMLLAACASGGEPVPTRAASAGAVSAAATTANAAAGQQAYARNCLSCHQADGYGVPNMQPAITGGSWVQGDPKALALFVMTGGFDSAGRKEGESHNVMPAFRQLPDDELAAILSYIRQKFGNGASAVSAAEVAEARATLPASSPEPHPKP